MNTHTLTNHGEIQDWVSAKNGLPAIRREPDMMGTIQARLTLNFARHRALTETPSQDDGISPVSWTAWLAELDRQHLALRVYDRKSPAFELVDRREAN